jgi:polar amino acid transport system permease protein
VTGPAVDPDLVGSRRSRLLGSQQAGRGVAVSVVSTVVFFGIIAWLVVNSPNWEAFRQAFFDPEVFADAFPEILEAFLKNVQLFLVCEVLVLFFGLVIAVIRSLPGPVFFPLRLIAIVYADFFRGVPGIVVIYVLGYGLPSLGIEGIPARDSEFLWAVIALTLIYSAYVSEVYRAGIDSVHPSQEAAARSLGMSRFKAMRFVVLPQAIRRVIPPLLNDFIGLQ